jgi:C4-dicarboxylate transporter, DctM subunit
MMSDVAIGFLGIGAVLVGIALRIPIGVALGGVSVIGIWLVAGPRAAFSVLSSVPYDFVAHWSLSSIPMFLLMGYVAFHARLTEALFRAAQNWLSALRGGLAISSIVGAALFSAVSGSSLACAAAMGRIAVPEMLKYRYDPALAAGVVAAAGTIGSMIPPSVIFLIYGNFAEIPISKLFIAGILPGILTAVMYSLTIVGLTIVRPEIAPKPPPPPPGERLRSLRDTWPVIIIVAGVFGGLFSGLFTPTEAGAVGALLATIVALAKRSLSMNGFLRAVAETINSTASIFLIAVGAVLLTKFLALTGVPDYLVEIVTHLGGGTLGLVIGVTVIYLILGAFLDPIGILLLTLPILLPVFDAFEINLFWMGVLLTKFIEVGLITPPVGLNVFVIKGVVGAEISIEKIFRGVLWFIAADIVTIVLLIAFPEISLFLTRFVD